MRRRDCGRRAGVCLVGAARAEDLQPVFSFKLRGAYNKIAHLTDAELFTLAVLPVGEPEALPRHDQDVRAQRCGIATDQIGLGARLRGIAGARPALAAGSAR